MSAEPQPGLKPLGIIVACHFLSAFGILGMSPYYATILEQSFGLRDPSWAGVFYVLPLFVMAIAGPLWGAFGDRFGKKLSVMRAQVGLTVVLFLCGHTHSPLTFALCLILQGLFGGTFSASNALLAEYYQGKRMAKALSTLQYSARLSLFLAPSILGLLVSAQNPLAAYLWLWILPGASFVILSLFLVKPPPPAAQELAPIRLDPVEGRRQGAPSFNFLLFIEFWFTLMTVITFPYFVKYFVGLGSGVSEKFAGIYFGVPHVVYLLLAFWVIRRASIAFALEFVALAFFVFTLSMIGHLLTANIYLLFLARVLMGVSLVFGFIYINELVGHGVKEASAGRAFGWLDTASKFAGVFAGLGASLLVHSFGLSAPFSGGAAIGGLFGVVVLLVARQNQVASRAK